MKQNRYLALETHSRPPPSMANTISNFHFDYLHTSLMDNVDDNISTLLRPEWRSYWRPAPPPVPPSRQLFNLFFFFFLLFDFLQRGILIQAVSGLFCSS